MDRFKKLQTRAHYAEMARRAHTEDTVDTMADLAGERCDRCGAHAQSRWQLRTGTLHFCGHHTREYVEALAQVAEMRVSEESAAGLYI